MESAVFGCLPVFGFCLLRIRAHTRSSQIKANSFLVLVLDTHEDSLILQLLLYSSQDKDSSFSQTKQSKQHYVMSAEDAKNQVVLDPSASTDLASQGVDETPPEETPNEPLSCCCLAKGCLNCVGDACCCLAKGCLNCF
jgi:hypothetical protein